MHSHKTNTFFRAIFYYRGDEMMAVRYGMYKAHYWTWTNSIDEFNHVRFKCPLTGNLST